MDLDQRRKSTLGAQVAHGTAPQVRAAQAVQARNRPQPTDGVAGEARFRQPLQPGQRLQVTDPVGPQVQHLQPGRDARRIYWKDLRRNAYGQR